LQAQASAGSLHRALDWRCAREEQGACIVARAWFHRSRQKSTAGKLVRILERASQRWIEQDEWTSRAAGDPALRAMFQRFAVAFDQRRSELSPAGRKPLAEDGEFEASISLIWARQQLSVALGRLKGYLQPWVLGQWPAGPLPLLSPSNPYYKQAEMRLSIMVSELEAEQSQERAASMFWLMYQDGVECSTGRQCAGDAQRAHWQHALMWQALADLMVVHHPGWPTHGRQAAGPLARHEGDSAGGPCPTHLLGPRTRGKPVPPRTFNEEGALPHFGTSAVLVED